MALKRPAMSVRLHPLAAIACRNARTSNAIERCHEEFERRIKTKTQTGAAVRRNNLLS
jgi:hypothetical protein